MITNAPITFSILRRWLDVGSPATYAIIQYLASVGPATQRVISDALSIPQATVSRALRESAGIVKNDQVSPAIYSFDASATMSSVNDAEAKFGNYSAVIRPDGRILLGGVPFDPVTDTLADKPVAYLTEQLIRLGGIADKHPVQSLNSSQVKTLAESLESLALTIRSRIAKGDFDGTSD